MRFIFDTQFRLRLSPSQCHSLVVCRHSEDPSAAHFQPLRRLHGQCTAPVDLPQIRAHQSSGLGPSRICLSRTLVSFGFGARLCGHTDLKGRPTLNQRAPEFASNHFCIFDPITTSHAKFPPRAHEPQDTRRSPCPGRTATPAALRGKPGSNCLAGSFTDRQVLAPLP